MIEGSGSGSRRPKNIRNRRIRIRNTAVPGQPTGELLDESGGPALVSAGEDLELLLHLGRPLRLTGHVLPVHLQPLFLDH